MVVEGELGDDHPAEWIARMAGDGEAIVAAEKQGPGGVSTFAEWSATWHLSIVPVATYTP